MSPPFDGLEKMAPVDCRPGRRHFQLDNRCRTCPCGLPTWSQSSWNLNRPTRRLVALCGLHEPRILPFRLRRPPILPSRHILYIRLAPQSPFPLTYTHSPTSLEVAL